jgi:hypothetical protein
MKMRNLTFFISLGLMMLLLAGCGTMSSNPQAATPDPSASGQNAPFGSGSKLGALFSSKPDINIPAGTVLGVTMQNSVSSASAGSGDHFEATIDEPVVINGKTVIPNGAKASGRVVAAKSSGHLESPGYLRLTLESVTISGKEVPVTTSTIFVQGGSHKKRNWAIIGGSTAGGALIGGLAGGPKGALIGSAIGAGGGTGVAYATGKKDVTIPAERHIGFRMTQPITTKG